jgi:hypothetical protein
MLTKSEVGAITKRELESALDYSTEISRKRAKLMDYFNSQPYGDEEEGQSSAVTSDVADVIQWMLPSLLRTFTQGKIIASFDGNTADDEQEAKEKTFLANHTFLNENDGVLILHNMFLDALLQYTGTVKVYWDETEETLTTKYKGLSELEYQKLLMTDGVELEEVVKYPGPAGFSYDANEVKIDKKGRVKYCNVPPEEFVISRSARDFVRPAFIGHRSPKTRSDLVQMGFSRKIVDTLPADEYYELNEQKNARYHDIEWPDSNPSGHSPNDIVYLGEYYLRVDVNEDGVSELWQVYYAGDTVLEMEQVEDHPFAVCVPIPIPHRAIGSCPAEQVADIQFRKSTLVRQMLNNIYQSNYPRFLYSKKVDLDDLLTPRAGGAVGVNTDAPDVAGHAQMLQVTPMIEGIMAAIEYTDMEREIRTGITRYSQGLDAESLNKTATGFKGIMDASQQRLELIARLFADGGVKQIFIKTVDLLSKYQDDAKSVKLTGKPLDIDPRAWGKNLNCRIDVGIGSGDRQEKIVNLNTVLNMQASFMQQGLVLSDQAKMYNTLEKLITEVGLKDVSRYFNNPEQPEEVLFAQNQQLTQLAMSLQQQLSQNPLADAEKIRAQAKLVEAQSKQDIEAAKLQQNQQQFVADMAARLTELELKYKSDVPGSAV